MKRNVSVVCVSGHYNMLVSGKIIKETPGSVESGTHCIIYAYNLLRCSYTFRRYYLAIFRAVTPKFH